MKDDRRQDRWVLAVDPATRGFGFAALEGPSKLVDWGICETKGDKQTKTLAKVRELVELYHPDVVVVEDPFHVKCRRRERAKTLIRAIIALASASGTQSSKVSVAMVQIVFGNPGTATKYEIATAIATRFPELARRLPPKRKPWQSEDIRISIFDATALALTYFSRGESLGPQEPTVIPAPSRHN